MGQIEIGKILKNNYPDWLSYQEIMKFTLTSKASVIRCLKQMSKRDEVELKMVIGKKITANWKTLYRSKGGIDNEKK